MAAMPMAALPMAVTISMYVRGWPRSKDVIMTQMLYKNNMKLVTIYDREERAQRALKS